MKFGDYVEIEQKRYGVKNEMYTCKVIGCLKSNTYVDVPVKSPEVETIHPEVVDVVACITCGIIEEDVLNYRISDIRPMTNNKHQALLNNCVDGDEAILHGREIEGVKG